MGGLWLGTWLRFIVGNRLGPYVPTPLHVGERMLKLAQVSASDVVYDLGCGDGRLLALAAEMYGARGVGYELNRDLVKEAREAVAGLGGRVEIREENAFSADLGEASVVMMYLSEGGNLKLLPKLRRELRTGSRVVTFSFAVGGLEAEATDQVDGIDLYLYGGWGGTGNQPPQA